MFGILRESYCILLRNPVKTHSKRTQLDKVRGMRSLSRVEVSPRQMGFFAGTLGAFGTVSYSVSFVRGSGSSQLDTVYYLALSLLFLAAGYYLWLSTPRGWWLGWTSMIGLAISGFTIKATDEGPLSQFTPLFYDGLMLVAGGIFFISLAHRSVYIPCFASTSLPHAAFGATPVLLITVGAAVLAASGGFGLAAGPGSLLFTLLSAPWILGPLWALLRGHSEWHAD